MEKHIITHLKLGDRVIGKHTTGLSVTDEYGTIVYIHPKRRFCIVEFDCNGIKMREAYQMDIRGHAYYWYLEHRRFWLYKVLDTSK